MVRGGYARWGKGKVVNKIVEREKAMSKGNAQTWY